MARRRRWKASIVLLLMVVFELVGTSWSYDSIHDPRMSGDKTTMQRIWRMHGRRGRGSNNHQGRGHNNGGRGGGFQRNRFIWDREDLRPDKRRLNKRPTTPQASNDDLISIESCCPTKFEVIEPLGGKNRTGHFVDLYRDETVRQRFYEVSCDPMVANKPCRFLENRHSRFSLCIQQFSYTYALVVPTEATLSKLEQPWYLDYISIRSGCACQVVEARKRRRNRAEI